MAHQIFVLMGIILVILSGCSGEPDTTQPPLPFMAQQKETPNVYMQALLVGELVLEDNCLRMKDSDGNSYLPVWPVGYSLRVEDEANSILDETGEFVAQVGDKLKLSGGEIPDAHIARYSDQAIPDECLGPYWIVGNEISQQ